MRFCRKVASHHFDGRHFVIYLLRGPYSGFSNDGEGRAPAAQSMLEQEGASYSSPKKPVFIPGCKAQYGTGNNQTGSCGFQHPLCIPLAVQSVDFFI